MENLDIKCKYRSIALIEYNHSGEKAMCSVCTNTRNITQFGNKFKNEMNMKIDNILVCIDCPYRNLTW